MSEKITGSRSATRLVRSTNANPAPTDNMTTPAKIGRPVAVSNKPKPSSTGDRSRTTAGSRSSRALAMQRGITHAANASATPSAIGSHSLIRRPAGTDLKSEAPQDGVADESRRDVAELQAEHERPWKRHPTPSAIDAALDGAGCVLAAGKERGRPAEAVGHRRREKAGTYDRHPDPKRRQAGPQRFGIGPQSGLARAIAGAVRQPAI